MLMAVISPAKRLRLEPITIDQTLEALVEPSPRFADQVSQLVEAARALGASGLREAMGISEALAELNADRFARLAVDAEGETNRALAQAQPALHLFQGDVYQGLDAASLCVANQRVAQDSLRILSGLYGLLRPFDLVQPYRLEMGTRLKVAGHQTLYSFWGEQIAYALAEDAAEVGAAAVVNLASQEYWGAARPEALSLPVVACLFKEWRGDTLKTISFNAKRARGLMARYIVEGRVDRTEGLKDFAVDDYRFSPEHSNEAELVFVRAPRND